METHIAFLQHHSSILAILFVFSYPVVGLLFHHRKPYKLPPGTPAWFPIFALQEPLGDLTLLVVTGELHKRLQGSLLNLFAGVKARNSSFLAHIEENAVQVMLSWATKKTVYKAMGSWKEGDLCSSSSSADASVDSITSPSDYSDDAASRETSSSPLDQPTSGPSYQIASLME